MSSHKDEVKAQIEKSITICYSNLKKRNAKVFVQIVPEKPEMLEPYEGPAFYFADYWVKNNKVKQ